MFTWQGRLDRRHRAWRPFVALAAVATACTLHAQTAPRDDVEETLAAVVRIEARIPPRARSSATLGSARQGSGVLIRDGYVLTIGYLVSEAESIEVRSRDGRSIAARLAAYDHQSGFAVLRLSSPLAARPLPLGAASALPTGAPGMVLTSDGRDSARLVQVVSRRPFTGNWEYMLDAAIYTSPAVPNWSGAALLGAKGELLGIGSLIVADAGRAGTQSPGNMFVPVDLLAPILDELIANGRRAGPARPWLGLNADELMGHLFVSRVSPGGPAEAAGIRSGDIVVGIGSDAVAGLAEFYGRLWGRGAAGIEVPLRVLQGAQLNDLKLRSIDREQYFQAPASAVSPPAGSSP